MSRPKREATRDPVSDQENGEDEDNVPQAPQHRKSRPASRQVKSQPAAPAPATLAAPAQQVDVGKPEVKLIQTKIEEYQARARTKLMDSKIQITDGELDSLVGKVVRHMLFKAHEEPDKPVTRNHLVELVKADYKEHKHARQLPTIVILAAQAKIVATFGYEMRELDQNSQEGAGPSAKAKEDGGNKQYVLRSLLPANLRELCSVDAAREKPRSALTMIVLALIQMSGGKLEAEQMWGMLLKLGVHKDMKEHPRFGNEEPKALIDRLERTKFLSRRRRQEPEGIVDVYEWGEHARDHITKAEMTEFINNEFSAGEAVELE